MNDMSMRANATLNFPGRTYRFYHHKSIYGFGHGLSYSTFSKFITSAPSTIVIKPLSKNHQNNTLSPDSTALQPNGQAIDVSSTNYLNLRFQIGFAMKNDGLVNGTHVVLVYSGNRRVQRGLLGCRAWSWSGLRGKTKMVKMELDVCKRLSLVDGEVKRKAVIGQHELMVAWLGLLVKGK
ncbi:hypothetical protein RHSIM_Rhsim02G0052000 [Rhododendron simsii]|uniref:Fibronectin type III-like domain-containing protein n=1 Tax=Rhododendron simsii TaxID=118357 RepID=A0A834HCY2_RHOSS|nr:hypothetical protein RHSIM_Rhsim02G0052000 [Rhododendron simsii]